MIRRMVGSIWLQICKKVTVIKFNVIY